MAMTPRKNAAINFATLATRNLSDLHVSPIESGREILQSSRDLKNGPT